MPPGSHGPCAVGAGSELVLPCLRARITRLDGSVLGDAELEGVSKIWIQQVPNFLRQFLEADGLKIDQLKWVGIKPPTEAP